MAIERRTNKYGFVGSVKKNEVIEPTFTEIDWKTQMEKMRKETIAEC